MLGLGLGLVRTKKQGGFTVDSLSEVITWLKGDTDVTETSEGSGVVARWRDQVGTTDWVSNQSGKQPSLSGSNENAALTFDGGDRLFQKEYSWNTTDDTYDFDFSHDVFDIMNRSGTGGFSCFFVINIDSSLSQTTHKILNEEHFVDDGTAGSGFTARTDIAGFINITTKGDFVGILGDNTNKTAFNSGTSAGNEISLDEKVLVCIEYAGGSGAITLRINGANKTLNQNNTGELGTITVGTIGASSSGLKGKLYELVNCNVKLSSDNRDLVEEYLINRHNIS